MKNLANELSHRADDLWHQSHPGLRVVDRPDPSEDVVAMIPAGTDKTIRVAWLAPRNGFRSRLDVRIWLRSPDGRTAAMKSGLQLDASQLPAICGAFADALRELVVTGNGIERRLPPALSAGGGPQGPGDRANGDTGARRKAG